MSQTLMYDGQENVSRFIIGCDIYIIRSWRQLFEKSFYRRHYTGQGLELLEHDVNLRIFIDNTWIPND